MKSMSRGLTFPRGPSTGGFFKPAILVLGIFLCVETFAADSPASEADKTQINRLAYKNGYIQYKPGYTLYIFPPFYTLAEKNKYIKDVYSSILLDQLQLNTIIYIKDPAPVAISYPEGETGEDPREKYLSGDVPRPEQFNFEAKMIYEFPGAMEDPAKLLNDPGQARFFLPEDLYLVSSIEELSGQPKEYYKIHVMIYRNAKIIYTSDVVTDEAEISKKVIAFTREISTKISGAKTGSLNISSTQEKASVYINNRYMGHTPLLLDNAVVGKNLVTIRKDGYEIWQQEIQITQAKETRVNAILEKIKSESRIVIKSKPEGSDVFFDVEYKGQTPLVIENIPEGIHRVHVQKTGFIDFFETIEVKRGKTEYEVMAKLAPGDSKEFYNINRPIVGPFSYEQMFKTSALLTAAGGLTGLFFQVQQENLQKNLNLYLDQGYSDTAVINKQLNDIAAYKALETGFYIGSGVLLAASIYLFIKYINTQDMPIAMKPNLSPGKNEFSVSLGPQFESFRLTFSRRL